MSDHPAPWRRTGVDAPAIDDDISAALRTVIDPCSAATGSPLNLLDMGLVRRAERIGSRVEVELRLTAPICWNAAPMMEAVEQAVSRIPDVDSVACTVDHGMEWTPANMTAEAKRRLQLIRPVQAR
ncbi:metal-sulfur cluster assembly factor [Nocardia sp. CA-135398]|uniref:metal-sulfur cluster assembly factor n=1 Tax=Nocardia sp. CA-135398 TaxID=3239977 RepID=UPI003D96D571